MSIYYKLVVELYIYVMYTIYAYFMYECYILNNFNRKGFHENGWKTVSGKSNT